MCVGVRPVQCDTGESISRRMSRGSGHFSRCVMDSPRGASAFFSRKRIGSPLISFPFPSQIPFPFPLVTHRPPRRERLRWCPVISTHGTTRRAIDVPRPFGERAFGALACPAAFLRANLYPRRRQYCEVTPGMFTPGEIRRAGGVGPSRV